MDKVRRLYSISPEAEGIVKATYDDLWPEVEKAIEKAKKVKAWWGTLPLVRKHLIVDYKFTDFDWDNLTETDRQLIELHYDCSTSSTREEETL